MRIGVPTEVLDHEGRVGLTPASVQELVGDGAAVVVQAGAGVASGLTDDDYAAAGATLTDDPAEAWAADLVVKVKEPVGSEYGFLRSDQVLFTYLHLAADRPLTERLLEAGTTAIAYETVQSDDGRLPLLAPMSQIAGRMAGIVGANLLDATRGGTGVLMGGIAGVAPAEVVVLGAGVAGTGAATFAHGLHASVTVFDKHIPALRRLDDAFGPGVRTLAATGQAIEEAVLRADLVVGTVLVPGAHAPQLVSRELVEAMRPGAALVDISIDQGGCFEVSRPTTHSDPTFTAGGSTVYAVANMPAAFPRTSTFALTSLTLPYVRALAGDGGWRAACAADPVLAEGLNTHDGAVLHAGVAEAHDLPPAEDHDRYRRGPQ
ncbi:alanine dehydrogenase [Georgenia sp. Z1491]|uniref:alanine dehydrogenase n=1 Tax=Georgenia sp. Z1491 TaxID=3416707 RepID=UPI003CEE9A7B